LITAAWHFSNPVSKGGFYRVDTLSFPEELSVQNFKLFYDDPFTLFEKNLKGIYQLK